MEFYAGLKIKATIYYVHEPSVTAAWMLLSKIYKKPTVCSFSHDEL